MCTLAASGTAKLIRFRQIPIIFRNVFHNLISLIANCDDAEKVYKSSHKQHDAEKRQSSYRYKFVPDSFDFTFCHKL